MDSLIDPREYAALSECTYLNQASLGLIPRTSLALAIHAGVMLTGASTQESAPDLGR
jgi:hypothetical protein